MIDGRVAILGVGTMGEAILHGLRSGSDPLPRGSVRGTVRNANRATELSKKLKVAVGTDNVGAVSYEYCWIVNPFSIPLPHESLRAIAPRRVG